MTPELKQQVLRLRDLSGAQHGRLKQDVQHELANDQARVFAGAKGGPPPARAKDSGGTSDIPMWGD
jgi:hypothetical protein